MTQELWTNCIDRRPPERTTNDIVVIVSHLRHLAALTGVPPTLLQQFAGCAYLEQLDSGVTLYRQGDKGTSWYAVLMGTLDVHVSKTGIIEDMNAVSRSLGMGSYFGESILDDSPRENTIVTREPCLLLRVEQRDFRILWQKNKDLMEDLLGLSKGYDTGYILPQQSRKNSLSSDYTSNETNPAALPLTNTPSEELSRAGRILRTLILTRSPGLVRDRRQQSRTFRRCLVGAEMVDWLLAIGSTSGIVKSRHQATGMWQALLEENVIQHVTSEYPFRDKYVFYRFTIDAEGETSNFRLWTRALPNPEDEREADTKCSEVLNFLAQKAPDAIMRLILRKPTYERTTDDLEMIYEELLHIKPLSHLSNSVKRELAGVIVFEARNSHHILFHQGEEGKSWYIILKGSVNVVIRGKGIVTSLYEGDDFGKLALINDAPRAATIIAREDNCHFLRVDKDDFNRILKDVEANTVRLKEHGEDVLVLEKISTRSSSTTTSTQFKYSVMSGTGAKMLEHLLETRLDSSTGGAHGGSTMMNRRRVSVTSSLQNDPDSFLDDFVLTHVIFMPVNELITELLKIFRVEYSYNNQDREFILSTKKRVVQFVHLWILTIGENIFDDFNFHHFLKDLNEEVKKDASLQEERYIMEQLMAIRRKYEEECINVTQKWKLPSNGQPISLFGETNGSHQQQQSQFQDFDYKCHRHKIRPHDDIIFRVYCADHTFCTLRCSLSTPVDTLKHLAADKLGLKHDELVLIELKSNGEKHIFNDGDVGVPTGLSLNGKIFISLKDHLDAVTCLIEQEYPTGDNVILSGQGASSSNIMSNLMPVTTSVVSAAISSSVASSSSMIPSSSLSSTLSASSSNDVELFSTRELAYYMTIYDWSLFKRVHEYELLYKTLGRHHFKKISSNLDIFLRRFNELQYWIITELLLASSSKRTSLLRKFIKLAAYLREYGNLNGFFAVVMGLNNISITRLHSSLWDKLPSKWKKLYNEFENFIDPSRNHRSYRMTITKTSLYIPFMPLILKDLTFIHEGNKNYTSNNLVNFEKMHMFSNVLRNLRSARGYSNNVHNYYYFQQLQQQQQQSDHHQYVDTFLSGLNPPTPRNESEIKSYISCLRCIDNQRILNQLSQKIEPKRN